MYSTQINSRDLLYSNPIDRFLGNDAGLRTSLESGFSSSFGYSQNEHSKELLSGNSGEIFSQTSKINVAESQTSNTDYQKYISQNLLFGKKGRSSKFSFGNKDNKSTGKEKSPFSGNEEQEQHGISEIKDLVGGLYDGIKTLNADILDVKDSVKSMEIEITRQNERIASFEDAFSQQTKIMEENEKHWGKSNKEDNVAKLQKLLTENVKDMKRITDKLKTSVENNQNKVLETIRKNFTTQTNANKKSLEEIKRCSEHILRKIETKTDEISTTFEAYLENMKRNYEDKLETKLGGLKVFINNSNSSIKETIAHQKANATNLPLYETSITPKQQNAPRKTYQNIRSDFSRPLSISSLINSTHGIKRENSMCEKRQPFVKQNSVHTPLVDVINRNKNSSVRTSSTYSPEIIKEIKQPPYLFKQPSSCISKQQYSRKCTRLNIKRKCATPLISPKQTPERRHLRSSNQFCPTFVNGVTRKNTRYEDNHIPNSKRLKPGRCIRNKTETETIRSSPYLTIYEATTMAEEFSFL